MTDRLFVGTAPQRLVGGALMMRDGPNRLVATLKMLGQFRGDDVQPATPCGFQPTANPRVTERAASRRQPIIQEFAIEIVPECVQLDVRAIGPSGRSGSDDEYALPR
jgi:hypothetical protein